jgi:hypothetical protein
MIAQAIRNHPRAIIPYVTAGLPDLDATGRILSALKEAGAAAIEIGVPFSDPMADGPVLQKASHLALQAGFRMDDLFGRLGQWSAKIDIPLIVMSYINPLMRRGLSDTLARLKDGGVKGVIIPDLPVEAKSIHADCAALGIDLIRLVAPTTLPERAKEDPGQWAGSCMRWMSRRHGPAFQPSRGTEGPGAFLRRKPICGVRGFGMSKHPRWRNFRGGFADGSSLGHLMDEDMKAPIGRGRREGAEDPGGGCRAPESRDSQSSPLRVFVRRYTPQSGSIGGPVPGLGFPWPWG